MKEMIHHYYIEQDMNCAESILHVLNDQYHLGLSEVDFKLVSGFGGGRGHIALEVHDNDPGLGKDRWGENAACRWRNMRIREL